METVLLVTDDEWEDYLRSLLRELSIWLHASEADSPKGSETYPDVVKRVLETDEYGPPPVQWEEVEPYIEGALDVDSDYSQEFVRRVSRWFPRTWEKEVEER